MDGRGGRITNCVQASESGVLGWVRVARFSGLHHLQDLYFFPIETLLVNYHLRICLFVTRSTHVAKRELTLENLIKPSRADTIKKSSFFFSVCKERIRYDLIRLIAKDFEITY